MSKNKIMKFLLTVFVCLMTCQFSLINSNAATFTVSKSQSSVSSGGKFNVTVKLDGAGQFTFAASNGTVSSSSAWIDGSGSVEVTAGQSGTTTVTVTAVDATASDESAITGSKSVSVSIKSASSSSSSSSQTTTKPSNSSSSSTSSGTSSQNSSTSSAVTTSKSSVNTLSSLTVSSGTLSPSFSASKTAYKVDLTSDVSTVTINAKAKDSKAKVVGTGKKDITVGSKTYTVTVYAENGSKKVYSITFNVSEKLTVYTTLVSTGEKLGILTDTSKASVPKGYSATKFKIDDTEVSGWTNKAQNIQIAYLSNEAGDKGLYLVENGKAVSAFKTIELNGKTYVLISIPDNLSGTENMQSTSIQIAGVDVTGWSFSDSEHANYTLVYLMNDQGEKSLYTYESSEATLQKYVPTTQTSDEVSMQSDSSQSKSSLPYVFMGTTALFAISTIALAVAYTNFKHKSISAIKEYYDRKNNRFTYDDQDDDYDNYSYPSHEVEAETDEDDDNDYWE